MEDKGVKNRYKSYARRLRSCCRRLWVSQRHIQSAVGASIVIQTLKAKWLRLIIGILVSMLLVPVLCVAVLMAIPSPWPGLVVFLIIVGGSVPGAYIDWLRKSR